MNRKCSLPPTEPLLTLSIPSPSLSITPPLIRGRPLLILIRPPRQTVTTLSQPSGSPRVPDLLASTTTCFFLRFTTTGLDPCPRSIMHDYPPRQRCMGEFSETIPSCLLQVHSAVDLSPEQESHGGSALPRNFPFVSTWLASSLVVGSFLIS
jgi:hypothetical protein